MENGTLFEPASLPEQAKPRLPIDPLSQKDFTPDESGEPRIVDWRLAQVLCFERERQIRGLIERNRERLEQRGSLLHREANSPSITGGRPGGEYHLNFRQALLVVIKSDAPNATAVQDHILDIYVMWARGELVPRDAAAEVKLADISTEAVAAAPELMQSLVGLRDPLAQIAEQLPELMNRQDKLARNIRRRQRAHDSGIERELAEVKQGVHSLFERVQSLFELVEAGIKARLSRQPPPQPAVGSTGRPQLVEPRQEPPARKVNFEL